MFNLHSHFKRKYKHTNNVQGTVPCRHGEKRSEVVWSCALLFLEFEPCYQYCEITSDLVRPFARFPGVKVPIPLVLWLRWFHPMPWRRVNSLKSHLWRYIGKSSSGFLSVEPVHVVMVVLRNIHSYGLKTLRNVDCIKFNFLGGERI